MIFISAFIIYELNTILLSFWQTGGIIGGIVLLLIGLGFILHKRIVNKLENENHALQQKSEAYVELLNYAKENEQKAKADAELGETSKKNIAGKIKS